MIDPAAVRDLSQYDREYKPADAMYAPGVDTLPDGPHDFEVVSADLVQTQETHQTLLKLGLRVISGQMQGCVIEKPYFFGQQISVDILGRDLMTLGFDADKWTAAQGRHFSAELMTALPRLPGRKFRATKKTKKDGNCNLYVNSLLPGSVLAKPAERRPAAAAAEPSFVGGLGGDTNEIPF